jgi:hypothetical protein
VLVPRLCGSALRPGRNQPARSDDDPFAILPLDSFNATKARKGSASADDENAAFEVLDPRFAVAHIPFATCM